MSETITETIALQKEIEDTSTGAVSNYHTLDSYYVALGVPMTQATFASYVSAKTFKAGKQSVGRSITIQINQVPPKNKDVTAWLYESAARPAAENEPNPSALAGATPITAQPA